MMFDSYPFRDGRRPQHVWQAHRQPRSAASVEPHIKLEQSRDEYLVSLQAAGFEVDNVQASVERDGHRRLTLTGLLRSLPQPFKYFVQHPTAVYSAPQGRRLGFLQAGMVLRGGPPLHGGWIAVEDEDEDLWVLDDGSLALASAGRQAQAHNFCKHIALPADAAIDRATRQELQNGSVVVIVPRRRASVRPEAPPPTRTAPASVQKPTPPKPSPKPAPSVPPPAVPPPPRQQLTKEKLFDLQAEAMADDIDIEPEMMQWSNEQVRLFFESGGSVRPTAPRAHTATASKASPQANKRTAPAPAAAPHQSPPPHAAKKSTRTASTQATPNHYDALLPTDAPLLSECTASTANVQTPRELVQEWEAIRGGGFMRTG